MKKDTEHENNNKHRFLPDRWARPENEGMPDYKSWIADHHIDGILFQGYFWDVVSTRVA